MRTDDEQLARTTAEQIDDIPKEAQYHHFEVMEQIILAALRQVREALEEEHRQLRVRIMVMTNAEDVQRMGQRHVLLKAAKLEVALADAQQALALLRRSPAPVTTEEP